MHRNHKLIGMSLVAALALAASPAWAGKGGNGKSNGPAPKVDVCHRTNGQNPFQVINVSSNALAAHLAHGDHLVGQFWVDADGDGFGAAGSAVSTCQLSGYVANDSDCNDTNAAINPNAADAICDGVDDNCSGAADEQYAPLPTACGLGVCYTAGATYCEGGVVKDSCAPLPKAEAFDFTCDSLDGDCDGSVDEDYLPVATACGMGVCVAAGITSCVNGAVADSCTPGPKAEAADLTCDGLDGDCDGATDEDYLPLATSCGVGACAAAGNTSCVAGGVTDSCVAGSPSAETCDGIDNNCNGATDDGVPSQSFYTGAAGTDGVGICQAGTKTCQGGAFVVTTPEVTPGTETCGDTTDEDCDNVLDNDCGPALMCDCTTYDACLYKKDSSSPSGFVLVNGYNLHPAHTGVGTSISGRNIPEDKRLEICAGHWGNFRITDFVNIEIQGAGVDKTFLSDRTNCPPVTVGRYGNGTGSEFRIGGLNSINGITWKNNCGGSPLVYHGGGKLQLSDVEFIDNYMGDGNGEGGMIRLRGNHQGHTFERVKVDNLMPTMPQFYWQAIAIAFQQTTTAMPDVIIKDSQFLNVTGGAFGSRDQMAATLQMTNVTLSGNGYGDFYCNKNNNTRYYVGASPYTGTCSYTYKTVAVCTP